MPGEPFPTQEEPLLAEQSFEQPENPNDQGFVASLLPSLLGFLS